MFLLLNPCLCLVFKLRLLTKSSYFPLLLTPNILSSSPSAEVELSTHLLKVLKLLAQPKCFMTPSHNLILMVFDSVYKTVFVCCHI